MLTDTLSECGAQHSTSKDWRYNRHPKFKVFCTLPETNFFGPSFFAKCTMTGAAHLGIEEFPTLLWKKTSLHTSHSWRLGALHLYKVSNWNTRPNTTQNVSCWLFLIFPVSLLFDTTSGCSQNHLPTAAWISSSFVKWIPLKCFLEHANKQKSGVATSRLQRSAWNNLKSDALYSPWSGSTGAQHSSLTNTSD